MSWIDEVETGIDNQLVANAALNQVPLYVRMRTTSAANLIALARAVEELRKGLRLCPLCRTKLSENDHEDSCVFGNLLSKLEG